MQRGGGIMHDTKDRRRGFAGGEVLRDEFANE
jgi:hypothetical protein